jgi:hypothetical protein
VDTDDPIIRKNVTNILRKIMTEDSGTWKALAYLEECKSQYPGFDFCVCYDSEGKEIGFIWKHLDCQNQANRFRGEKTEVTNQ